MKKVLIISYRFPPLNHISSKRFGTMCKYFKNNGYESYVVTVSDSQYLGAKHDLSIPIPENNIFRIDSKSEHQGMQEKCLNILFELFNKFRFSSRVLGVGELQWYINVKKNIDLRKLKDIDIIIGTYGPMSNLYIAKYLSKKLGCPYIIDMRDFISDWKVVPSGYKRSYKVDRAIEKKIVFSADGIAVVSPGMKTILQERYPKKRIISIFNGWDEFPAKDVESVQEKYLYFAGTLYEHILAGIFLLLKALKKVNEKEKIKLIIRSLGPNNLNRKIKPESVKFNS